MGRAAVTHLVLERIPQEFALSRQVRLDFGLVRVDERKREHAGAPVQAQAPLALPHLRHAVLEHVAAGVAEGLCQVWRQERLPACAGGGGGEGALAVSAPCGAFGETTHSVHGRGQHASEGITLQAAGTGSHAGDTRRTPTSRFMRYSASCLSTRITCPPAQRNRAPCGAAHVTRGTERACDGRRQEKGERGGQARGGGGRRGRAGTPRLREGRLQGLQGGFRGDIRTCALSCRISTARPVAWRKAVHVNASPALFLPWPLSQVHPEAAPSLSAMLNDLKSWPTN